MTEIISRSRLGLGAVFAALMLGLFANFLTAAPAAAQSREGSSFIVGTWQITGAYSDTTSVSVNVTVTFRADGTMRDEDGYNGRWVISGSSFLMYYPEEGARVGYVGVISGNAISGRFEAPGVAGTFRMRRVGGGGGGGGGGNLSEADVLGVWRVIGGSGCADWQRFIQTSRGMSWEYSVDGRQTWIENEASNGRYTLTRDALNINGRRILERRSNGEFWIVSQGPGGNYNCHVSR